MVFGHKIDVNRREVVTRLYNNPTGHRYAIRKSGGLQAKGNGVHGTETFAIQVTKFFKRLHLILSALQLFVFQNVDLEMLNYIVFGSMHVHRTAECIYSS